MVTIERSTSEISALQLPRPPVGEAAAAAVARSEGWGTAIDDEAILSARRWLASAEGVFVEPAAVATVAALLVDADNGRLWPDARPGLILRGKVEAPRPLRAGCGAVAGGGCRPSVAVAERA